MKKTSLYIASALMTVLLVGGMAEAKTDAVAATATAAPKAGEMMQGKMQGKMMGMRGAKLSDAGEKLMKDAMDKMMESHKASWEQMKTKREEMAAIMKAATFDKAAYVAKSEEINALHNQMTKQKTDTMADVIAQLSVEDRASLADRPMHRMGMGKGGPKGDGMGRPMMDDDKDGAPAMEPMKK